MTRTWTPDDLEATRETISIQGWVEPTWDGAPESVPPSSCAVDGWRLRGCDWLAATRLPRSTKWTITHCPTGATLLGPSDGLPMAPACGSRLEALDLLEHLSRETWLRDLTHPAGADAASRLLTLVTTWRARCPGS